MEKFTMTGTLRTICKTNEDPVTLIVSSGTCQTNTGFQYLSKIGYLSCLNFSNSAFLLAMGRKWFEMKGLVCKNYA